MAYAAPCSLVGTISHEHHKLRRSFVNSFFSKRSVTNLTPVIQEKVDKLIQRFENAYKTDKVLTLQLDFAALAADVITHYCYGWARGYLDHSDGSKSNDLVDAVNGLMTMFHVNRFFPFLSKILLAVPPALVRWLQPCMADLFDMKARLRQQAKDTLEDRDSSSNDEKRDDIFHSMTGPNVPNAEKTLDRLVDEGALLLGAGTETTARAIAVSMFHVIRDEDVGRKLLAELRTVMDTPRSKVSWSELEKLPYLVSIGYLSICLDFFLWRRKILINYSLLKTGVVNEGLRLSHGMTTRLGRIAMNDPILYKDWVIPAGVS